MEISGKDLRRSKYLRTYLSLDMLKSQFHFQTAGVSPSTFEPVFMCHWMFQKLQLRGWNEIWMVIVVFTIQKAAHEYNMDVEDLPTSI